ncbi:MAG: glycosyltransferase family 39 protein [Patescibacteria group bacterium]|nr:glycosyltransferase family 39 protein [Patescibacteria group bacterium]MBU1877306.1 glycosyltransferase family 39 protein [Patescibacteria group bacterium]
MSDKFINISAGLLLGFMFLMAITSMAGDSLTMDEVAHLPAGYSYVTQQDMRLNPEHPPLIKDLAGLPLLLIKDEINFPSQIDAWQKDVNGQWVFGANFFYQSGNPTDKMIFLARIPMVLVLIVLGFYIFKWTKELFGGKAALLATFLFSFSPTFLTHGRLVTTDVGAAAGMFIATYYFLRSMKNPTKNNIILAGLSLGIAQLCKFSAILIIPFFFIIAFGYWLLKLDTLKNIAKNLILIMIIAFAVIGLVYQYHIWNYPIVKQYNDTSVYLKDYPNFIQKPVLWAINNPVLRGYAQYFTGVLMVLHRAAYGHTMYFMGEVSNLGWKNYFPIVYLIKEPLTLHLLTLTTLITSLGVIKKYNWQEKLLSLKAFTKEYFNELAMLLFLGIYWASSLTSNLNLGVRHLLPTLPFVYLLVSGAISKVIKKPYLKLKTFLFGALIASQTLSVIAIYPHFMAYFNELAGGPENGHIFTVDSNLDWGQDLKRLKKWVDDKKIDKIYVDYFGGGDARYYLGEKFSPWWVDRKEEEFPKGNYLAISASFLQISRGVPAEGFDGKIGSYHWLDKYQPVDRIGYSIFIYYID